LEYTGDSLLLRAPGRYIQLVEGKDPVVFWPEDSAGTVLE
jgi:hypothetical protein